MKKDLIRNKSESSRLQFLTWHRTALTDSPTQIPELKKYQSELFRLSLQRKVSSNYFTAKIRKFMATKDPFETPPISPQKVKTEELAPKILSAFRSKSTSRNTSGTRELSSPNMSLIRKALGRPKITVFSKTRYSFKPSIKKGPSTLLLTNSVENGQSGVNRKRALSTGINWGERRLDGLKLAQYSPQLVEERSIQAFILLGELKVLIDKAFQLKFILQQGVKMKPTTLVKKMPLQCLISLNSKLEGLCSALYKISSLLLQEFQTQPEALGIKNIKAKLESDKRVKDEAKNFTYIMKLLEAAIEYIKGSTVAYEVMLKDKARKSYPFHLFNQLEYLIYRCRLVVNNVEKEYYIYDDNFCTKEEEAAEMKQKKTKAPVEATELKDFIDANLHKIYSKREFYTPLLASLQRRRKKPMNKEKVEEGQLKDMIKVLQKCKGAKNPELRGEIVGLIKKFESDYDKVVAKRFQTHSPTEDL